MSAIEFTAQPGKTFSVQLYQLDGTPIGDAITGVTDSLVPTRYRASTGSTTGTVYVVATTTNLRVTGYANLDKPAAASGYSPLSNLTDLENDCCNNELTPVTITSASGALSIIKANILARITEVTSAPKPNYSIDGQTVSWQSYLDSLWRQLDYVNSQINASEPFEEVSRGITS